MSEKHIVVFPSWLIDSGMQVLRKMFQHSRQAPPWEYGADKNKSGMNWSYASNGPSRNGMSFSRGKRRCSSSKRDIKSIDMSLHPRDKKRWRQFPYEKGRGDHPAGSSSAPLPNPWTLWIVYLVVIFVSTASYSNSLDGEFVHDDLSAIKTNGDVIGKRSVWRIFLNDFWGKPMADRTSHKSYRPLTILTFRFNAFLHNLEPRGFHIFNVALHATVSAVFVKMCSQVARMSISSAFIAGIHFSTHPIHTEAVSGIVGRADILSCLFVLASFLSYHRCQKERGNKKLLLISMLLALCAMLSKEHGITVLGINFIWDIFVHRHHLSNYLINGSVTTKMSQLLIRLCIMAVGGLILVSFRLTMLQGSLPQFSDQDNPASFISCTSTRIRTFAYLPAFNFWLLLAPVSLNYDWQMGSIPLISQWADGRNVGCLMFYFLLLAGLIYPAWKLRLRTDIALGLMFLTIPFIPASNLLFRVGFVVAERILYIPSLGFSLLVGAGAERIMSLQKSVKISLTRIVLLLVLCLFAYKTWLRNQDWRNRESLFTSGLRMLPHNAKMHYNYANLQKDLGNVDQAIHHYREALRLWPRHASAHNNIGTLLNDTVEAEEHFQQALRINPNHANAFFNLANLKYQQGQTSLAVRLMERSINLESSNPDALTNLAAMYADIGMPEKAQKLHVKVLKLEPESADHLNNYAAFLQKLGKLEEALKYYQEALTKDGNHTIALLNTARLMKKLKFNDKAEVLYHRALLRDDDPQTKDGLGVLYLSTGRANKAERLFREALQHRPNDPIVKVHLAQAHVHQRKFNEAEALLLADMTQYNSNRREVLHQLATLYSHLNRTTDALLYIQLALKTCTPTDLACASLYGFHGDLSKDLDDLVSAISSYKKAEELLNTFSDKNKPTVLSSILTHVQLNLGAIYHVQGEYEKAWRYYRAALKQDPSNPVLLENIKKLKNAEFLQRKNSSCVQQAVPVCYQEYR